MNAQALTFEQVMTLPAVFTRSIPPEWEDYNGHVNIQYYMALIEQSGWLMFADVGLDEEYFAERRQGLFDLEHHLKYLAELHVGDEVSVHSRMLDRSEKRLHGMMFIVNQTRRQLSCTLEYITSGADLDLRRTAAFPEDVGVRFDELIRRDQELEWEVPVCGVMAA
jgi:acyl-CoA thioester hydrolase